MIIVLKNKFRRKHGCYIVQILVRYIIFYEKVLVKRSKLSLKYWSVYKVNDSFYFRVNPLMAIGFRNQIEFYS